MRFGKWVGVVLGMAVSAVAWADPRPWAFVEDAYPEGKGILEYEQYVTYSTHTSADHGFDNYQFKQEFEYGVTDNFDLSLYAGTFSYEDSAERTGTQYEETAIEGIYYFSSPVGDPIGFALYTELAFGEHGFDVENKLIFQKDIGNWSFAYNLVAETAFDNAYNAQDGEAAVVEGELGNVFGASYAINRNFRAGAELTVESVFPHWDDYEDTAVYAGPNAGYWTTVGQSEFWITVTPLFQLSSVEDEPDFDVRMIVGWVF